MTNFTDLTVESLTIGGVHLHQDLASSGAITIKMGIVTLSNNSAPVAATIAKPTTIVDDFKRLTVSSLTTQAHTLAVGSGSFGNGGAGEDVATFDAAIGSSISLMAYGGEWYITGKQGVTVA
jgi:hypothetical protein